MGVDRGGGAPPVAEQPSDGGKSHAVHETLQRPGVAAVMQEKAGQPRFLSDAASEWSDPLKVVQIC